MATIVNGCHFCGKDSYAECSDDDGASFELIPTTRELVINNVPEEGLTTCNSETGGDQTVCPGTTKTTANLQGDMNLCNRVCPVLEQDKCKTFRFHSAPFLGATYYEFDAIIGPNKQIRLSKEAVAAYDHDLELTSGLTKPTNI